MHNEKYHWQWVEIDKRKMRNYNIHIYLRCESVGSKVNCIKIKAVNGVGRL